MGWLLRAAPVELVERDGPLSTLRGLLDNVRAGSEGRLAWVSGEAGAGKTALLRCFCAEQDRSVRILWGSCEPLRTPRPLGPLIDIAEVTRGELADRVMDGARPYEVAAALLAELRAAGPTVLVLEDLHWADEATLDVVTFLASRFGAARVLVLASYRDDELARAPGLRVALGESGPRPARLKVPPLTLGAVAALAAPYRLEGGGLHALTGGNPFFVTEVLAAGGERLPETVRDAVLARVARLTEPARELLEGGAIVPGEVDLWLLDRLCAGRLDGLEECLASGVLTADGSAVSFRHELARVAVEEAIVPTRRVALHRAALVALESRGGGAWFARLAYHAEAAGDCEAVLRWAPVAAEQASRGGSHREAAAQYERALRCADALPAVRQAALLQQRAHECWLSDQFDFAVEAEAMAVERLRLLDDRLAEGDAVRTLSRLLFFVGRVREGEELAMRAVELLEGLEPGHELAMAYANVSQRRMAVADLEAAIGWGDRALELAQRLGDVEVLVYALTNIGAAEAQAGLEEGRRRQEEALALALDHGLEDYAGRAFMSIVRRAVDRRSFTVADTYIERAAEYCRKRGLDTWRLYLLADRARMDLARGRWDEAADAASFVLRDPRSATVPRGQALVILGLVRARRGDPQGAIPLDEELNVAWSTDEIFRIGAVSAARAEAAWLAGDADRVGHETDQALALAVRRGTRWVVGEIACWRWRAGVREELPAELVAEPYRLSIAGDWAAASARWRDLGCPYETALALADADEERALRQAFDELTALGARPAAAIVARRLRERGVRGVPRGPRATTRQNPAGLTAREVEVLELLAKGLTNQQIAEQLVVSGRTVDHHVSAILRKLNARTRGEAAAEAIRLSRRSQSR